jgi:hypothetical protein
MRNTEDRENLHAANIWLRLILEAILRDIIECLYMFEQITVNKTWNDHEQYLRITFSFTMGHNGPKRV